MKTLRTWLVLLIVGAFAAVPAQEDAVPVSRSDGKVFVFPIEGPIDKPTLFMFRRAHRDIKTMKPRALILEMKTPGGRLIETREIIRLVRSIKKTIPVYAFVNPDAYSAGALISLSTKAIYMTPTAHIGDAMPILIPMLGGAPQELPPSLKEKMMSPVRAMARGLAQENGYSEELAVSMVDPDAELKIGDAVICPKGQLLTLTGNEAAKIYPPMTEPLLATKLVESIDEVLADVGLQGAEIVRFERTASERLATWLTLIGPLLLGGGLLLAFVEFKTPGFGVAGSGAAVLLFLFFFGHYIAGLAGGFELLLVVVGIILLIFEIFVIPGFGVTGIAGILCIVSGSLLSMIPVLPKVSPLPDVDGSALLAEFVQWALLRLVVAMAVCGVFAWLLSKILPKTTMYNRLVLSSQLTKEQGYVAGDVVRNNSFIDCVGVAMTSLRPAGTAVFGDERLDVVTSGDLVEKGAKIKVIKVEGSRVVVERASDETV